MFDWKKPTVQMLGRWQPWHKGHQELFKRCINKTGQVIIQVRDVQGASGGDGQDAGRALLRLRDHGSHRSAGVAHEQPGRRAISGIAGDRRQTGDHGQQRGQPEVADPVAQPGQPEQRHQPRAVWHVQLGLLAGAGHDLP